MQNGECGRLFAGWWVVEEVEDGFLVGVDPSGWGEPGSSAADGDGPVGLVDLVVVEQAEKYPVV